jgi:hypothetical protein
MISAEVATAEIVVLWIGLALLIGFIANSAGRNGFLWFLLAVVISPLLAGIFLLMAGAVKSLDRRDAALREARNSKKCPYCAEIIKREATICRFCGKEQPRTDAHPFPSPLFRLGRRWAAFTNAVGDAKEQPTAQPTEATPPPGARVTAPMTQDLLAVVGPAMEAALKAQSAQPDREIMPGTPAEGVVQVGPDRPTHTPPSAESQSPVVAAKRKPIADSDLFTAVIFFTGLAIATIAILVISVSWLHKAQSTKPSTVQNKTNTATTQQPAPTAAPSKCYGHAANGALTVYAPINGRCP